MHKSLKNDFLCGVRPSDLATETYLIKTKCEGLTAGKTADERERPVASGKDLTELHLPRDKASVKPELGMVVSQSMDI